MNQVSNNSAPRATFTRTEVSTQLFERGVQFSNTGRVQDLTQARRLFQEAAILGNANAMDRLGFMFQYGEGGPIDLNKASYVYEEAIRLGHKGALFNLLCMRDMVTSVFGAYSFVGPDVNDGI